jgi:hypothetical protein
MNQISSRLVDKNHNPSPLNCESGVFYKVNTLEEHN